MPTRLATDSWLFYDFNWGRFHSSQPFQLPHPALDTPERKSRTAVNFIASWWVYRCDSQEAPVSSFVCSFLVSMSSFFSILVKSTVLDSTSFLLCIGGLFPFLAYKLYSSIRSTYLLRNIPGPSSSSRLWGCEWDMHKTLPGLSYLQWRTQYGDVIKFKGALKVSSPDPPQRVCKPWNTKHEQLEKHFSHYWPPGSQIYTRRACLRLSKTRGRSWVVSLSCRWRSSCGWR